VLTFLGLYGINSPLPRSYHDHIASDVAEQGEGKVALQDFLDIFSNRFYWLYHLAWRKNRRHLLYPIRKGEGNTLWSRLSGRREEDSVVPASLDSPALLHAAPVLCTRTRTITGLRLLLQEFFPEFPVGVSGFIPERQELREPVRLNRTGEGAMSRKAFMARTFVDRRHRIRVDVGPVSYAEAQTLAPWGENAPLMRDIIAFYLPVGMKADTRILVRVATIPLVRMGDPRARLGRGFSMGLPKCDVLALDYAHERYESARHSPQQA
jgi:type VI secretion system protein ImpH